MWLLLLSKTVPQRKEGASSSGEDIEFVSCSGWSFLPLPDSSSLSPSPPHRAARLALPRVGCMSSSSLITMLPVACVCSLWPSSRLSASPGSMVSMNQGGFPALVSQAFAWPILKLLVCSSSWQWLCSLRQTSKPLLRCPWTQMNGGLPHSNSLGGSAWQISPAFSYVPLFLRSSFLGDLGVAWEIFSLPVYRGV